MRTVALIFNKKPKFYDKNFRCDEFSEWDSEETINSIASTLRKLKNNVHLVQANNGFIRKLLKVKPDIAFNIAECSGSESREALVPAILEFLKIPFTGSSSLTLSIALNKGLTKQILQQYNIPTPRFQIFYSVKDTFDETLRFPLIVKPNNEGSSKGINLNSVVYDKENLLKQVNWVIENYKQNVLVEEFIEGKEITIGIIGNDNKLKVLEPMEIDFSACSDKGFYSWEIKEKQGSKYFPEFFCPARLTIEKLDEIKKIALQVHKILNCRDFSRCDFRVSFNEEKPFVIEINPLSGLDPKESNIVKIAEFCDISYKELLNIILQSAWERYHPMPK